jgi:hypothetical protein
VGGGADAYLDGWRRHHSLPDPVAEPESTVPAPEETTLPVATPSPRRRPVGLHIAVGVGLGTAGVAALAAVRYWERGGVRARARAWSG